MAEEDELYISVHPDTYRGGKAGVLICKSNSLISLKKLHNLKILAKQKASLRDDLRRLFVSVKSDINSIQKMIPTTEVPKAIRKVINPPRKKVVIKKEAPLIQEVSSKTSSIDIELQMIQEKLRELNS